MASILAIHAHPDDIETLGAATLAVLAANGHRIAIATVTAGDCGSDVHPLDETARIRKGEAARAAAVIGAEYRCGDVPDLCVFNDDACRRIVTELVRWARPDVVITASPGDYHPDHEAVSVLVRDACFASSVPNYTAGPSASLPAVPHLYFMDPIGGRERDGTRVVGDFGCDVAGGIEAKRRMLACHESQFAWVARLHDTPDQVASMERWTRRRGRDFGVEFAEGYRQYRHHPYPSTPLLQDLLGDRLVHPV